MSTNIRVAMVRRGTLGKDYVYEVIEKPTLVRPTIEKIKGFLYKFSDGTVYITKVKP